MQGGGQPNPRLDDCKVVVERASRYSTVGKATRGEPLPADCTDGIGVLGVESEPGNIQHARVEQAPQPHGRRILPDADEEQSNELTRRPHAKATQTTQQGLVPQPQDGSDPRPTLIPGTTLPHVS
jgi:hypothetical protein